MSMSDRLRDEYVIATDFQCVSIAGVCMLKKQVPVCRIRLSHVALQGTSQSNTTFQGNWHESLIRWFCQGCTERVRWAWKQPNLHTHRCLKSLGQEDTSWLLEQLQLVLSTVLMLGYTCSTIVQDRATADVREDTATMTRLTKPRLMAECSEDTTLTHQLR